MIILVDNNAFANVERTPNIIKRYFFKFLDLDEQKFSEKCYVAWAMIHFMYIKKMCDKTVLENIDQLINYTTENIEIDIYKLDRRVNSNDVPDYKRDKHTKIEVSTLDGRIIVISLVDIQSILFNTLKLITEIVHEQVHKNNMADYWS